MKNQAKFYRNSKLEANTIYNSICGARQTDFRGQNSDFGSRSSLPMLILDPQKERSVEWRRPIAKLESSEYSWSTEKFHTPAILSGCGGLFTLRASRRGGDRESFRENSSKNLILQIFRTRRTHGDIENYQLSKFQP